MIAPHSEPSVNSMRPLDDKSPNRSCDRKTTVSSGIMPADLPSWPYSLPCARLYAWPHFQVTHQTSEAASPLPGLVLAVEWVHPSPEDLLPIGMSPRPELRPLPPASPRAASTPHPHFLRFLFPSPV